MPAERGSAFLLKIGNGATPVVYQTVAGLRTTQCQINGEAVNVTTKDSGGWRELLSGAGVRSVGVSAAGVFTGSAAEARVRGNALSGVLDDYRLTFESGETMTGRFVVTRLDYAGDYNGERTYTIALESSGQVVGGMSVAANPARGEASLRIAGETLVLRPTFAALVAAEQELGPLFALVERAADGRLALGELVALFWHCLRDRPIGLSRDAFGEAVAAGGLAAVTPALRVLIGQVLSGR